MKNLIAAKMSAMRKSATATISSAANAKFDPSPGPDCVPASIWAKEPSSHHGAMRVILDDSSGGYVEELVDIVFCIAADSVHAVTEMDSSVVFEADFKAIKEITWNYTECSVSFLITDGTASPSFVFVTTLICVETLLTSALCTAELQNPPQQIYIGVLVGRRLPTSPIQLRRLSVTNASTTPLPGPLRRELLFHERPPRNHSLREKLAVSFLKSGTLTFPCTINGDARGLRLDSEYLRVFPSPDCREQSACLFSYQYEQVESCDVRSGTRLELRFNRSGAKQPTFIAFQSQDALYIRDGIWFFKHGMSIYQYFRSQLTYFDPNSPKPGLNTFVLPRNGGQSVSPGPMSRRRASLRSFADDGSLQLHIQSLCIVIGCSRRCPDVMNDHTTENRFDVDASGAVTTRRIWFCEDHAAVSDVQTSPSRSPSKRAGLLSRTKSVESLTQLVHKKHYTQGIKYHGVLLKSGGKFQLTKNWSQKIVALIDTPVGGCLCYFNKLSHCPGLTDTPKERRSIDLSGVICIRRESAVGRGPGGPPYAFDIVTLYRSYTFATNDLQEFEAWLSVLADAVENSNSLSPDPPLRYPVRCLRDPLQSTLLRSDGNASLEVSSNGVTLFSGLEGEFEAYSWYFTEIQKWSVARQHDGTLCCFLSCSVNCPNMTGDGNSEKSSKTAPYRDFLLQTNESEKICTVIEFFVSRCMVKLEILGMMHKLALPHLTVDSISSRFDSAGEDSTPCSASSGKRVKDAVSHMFALECHEVLGDSSPQVGDISSDRECFPKSIKTQTESSEIHSSIDVRHAEFISRCGKLNFDHSVTPVDATRDDEAIYGKSNGLPVSGAMREASSDCGEEQPTEAGVQFDKEVGSTYATGIDFVNLVTVDRILEEDGEIVRQLDRMKAVPIDSSYGGEDEIDASAQSLLSNNHQPVHDGNDIDSDRFQSFEYCECTVGDSHERSCDVQLAEVYPYKTIAQSEDDDIFEDARCDLAECSAVLLDGVPENDEDSLIIVENEEPNRHDVIGYFEAHFDPVDVLPTVSCDSDDQDQVLAAFLGTEQRVRIPIYTKRVRVEEIYFPELEYDDKLPRITVYSVRFKRGYLCQF